MILLAVSAVVAGLQPCCNLSYAASQQFYPAQEIYGEPASGLQVAQASPVTTQPQDCQDDKQNAPAPESTSLAEQARVNLKGIISFYDGPTPDELVGNLVTLALSRDGTNDIVLEKI